jgi:F420-dependent oxidoreductase-like protein
MDLRIFTEPQQGASYETLLRVAQRAEELGFDAFFRSDHYLPIWQSSGLPGPTDAWVTLAGIARETDRIRLGTLMTAATFRHPGPLAISVAQVDAMSAGRVEFGFGAGWYEQEHTAYGLPFPSVRERFDRYEEQLEVIVGLWETPEGRTYSFSGKHYTFTDSPALPKPYQTPRPPVIVGGGGKRRTPALAARFANEFNLPFAPVAATAEQFTRVRDAVAEAGRASDSMIYSVAQVLALGRDEAEYARRAEAIGREPGELRENAFGGTPQEVLDKIGRFAEETGATRFYLQVLDLSDLEHLDLVAEQIAPHLA